MLLVTRLKVANDNFHCCMWQLLPHQEASQQISVFCGACVTFCLSHVQLCHFMTMLVCVHTIPQHIDRLPTQHWMVVWH